MIIYRSSDFSEERDMIKKHYSLFKAYFIIAYDEDVYEVIFRDFIFQDDLIKNTNKRIIGDGSCFVEDNFFDHFKIL